MVEVMKIMTTSFKRPHARTAALSAPDPAAGHHQPLHAFAGSSWTLMGKSGSVSCGVTTPFFWVLMHTRFCLCPPRVCFPVLYKFWWFFMGSMATSSKMAYAIPRSVAPRAPVAGHC